MGNSETAPATAQQLETQYQETLGSVAAQALGFKIEDASDREMATELLGDLRERKRRGQKLFQEPKRLAKAAHTAMCNLETRVLAGTLQAEEHVEGEMRAWDNAVRKREDEERQRLENEKLEQERIAREAYEQTVQEEGATVAAAEGVAKEMETTDPEGAAMIRDTAHAQAGQAIGQAIETVAQAQTAPAAAATPAPRPSGRRAKWVARVDDLHALVKAAAGNAALLNLLEANTTELNKLARDAGAEKEIVPGVMAIDEGTYVGQ
jgi:hypothetical protein